MYINSIAEWLNDKKISLNTSSGNKNGSSQAVIIISYLHVRRCPRLVVIMLILNSVCCSHNYNEGAAYFSFSRVCACARRMKPHIIILLLRVLFPSRWVCPGIVSLAPYDNLSAPHTAHSDSRWHPIHLSGSRSCNQCALKWRYYHRYRPAYFIIFLLFAETVGRTPKCARESHCGRRAAVQ